MSLIRKGRSSENGAPLANRVNVTSAIQLSGALDSSKEYFLDGIIDFTGTGLSIEVPQGGLNLRGYNFDISGLKCDDAAYTLFTSPVGGSGNVLGMDYLIDVNGAGSQVYNLVSDTGFEAFEFSRVNYNNCSSLGTIDNYRQGLESGTGRFGGTPELTLAGVWVGGFFIDTSIVRSLTDGAYSLFKAGAGFTMASRFRSNQNIDLPASASFFDFSDANFANPSTVQLNECLISRDGSFDANDANITPNILASNLSSSWGGNVGIQNTFEGGKSNVSTEIETTINTINVFEDLAGTFTALDLQHFDSPVNGQLRHLGDSPREYEMFGNLSIIGPQNDDVTVKFVIWDDSAASFSDAVTQIRTINQLQGGRNVGFYTLTTMIQLDKNDYVKVQIANNSGAGNVTAELDSFSVVKER